MAEEYARRWNLEYLLYIKKYCRTLLSRWVASSQGNCCVLSNADANAQRHCHHRVLTLPILPHWMTTFRQRCWKMQWYNQLPRCWYIKINITVSTLLLNIPIIRYVPLGTHDNPFFPLISLSFWWVWVWICILASPNQSMLMQKVRKIQSHIKGAKPLQ